MTSFWALAVFLEAGLPQLTLSHRNHTSALVVVTILAGQVARGAERVGHRVRKREGGRKAERTPWPWRCGVQLFV